MYRKDRRVFDRYVSFEMSFVSCRCVFHFLRWSSWSFFYLVLFLWHPCERVKSTQWKDPMAESFILYTAQACQLSVVLGILSSGLALFGGYVFFFCLTHESYLSGIKYTLLLLEVFHNSVTVVLSTIWNQYLSNIEAFTYREILV